MVRNRASLSLVPEFTMRMAFKEDVMSPAKRSDETKQEAADRELDEALEESFPASDPIQSTGTSAGGPEEHETEKKKPAKR